MATDPILPAERAARMRAAGLWPDRLLIDDLDEVAAHDPGRIAVVDHNSMTGRRHEISYAALRDHSIRIAAGLMALGVDKGDVVAVQLPSWWHYAAIHAACVRIGAVINPLMPIFRERELEFMLGYAESKVMIVPREFRGFDYPAMMDGLRAKLPALRHVLVIGGADPATSFEQVLLGTPHEQAPGVEALFADRRAAPDDVTEIMYTSGTTGQPKGVMHTANTLYCKALLATELFSFTERDAVFMGSPVAHQTGFMYGVVFSIRNHTKLVLLDQWDALAAARIIGEEGCTLTLGATPFVSDLVQAAASHGEALASLRLFLCAGAPIPRVLVHEAARALPNMYMMSAWGMTEMGISTATYPGDPAEKVFETDGRALPGHAVRIVDEQGEVVPNGTEGRLQAQCATLFVGYLKRPEAYEVDEDSWFETGDNARMDDDGYIRITGRSKDIIIRGGENIPVVEVEELLYRHPAVQDAAVVAMPDTRLGERACAFVSLKPGAELGFDGLVDYLLQAKLTRQYLPERLELVDDFPRTPSGKIQKFVLRERAKAFTAAR
ncbi:MAG: AMP-binding protein [Gammaproteobacteria bacterium]|nr:AMP-binding protein [Gammaproteobacteria bacterium]